MTTSFRLRRRTRPGLESRPRSGVGDWPIIDGAVLGDDAFADDVWRRCADSLRSSTRSAGFRPPPGQAAPRTGGADPRVREQHAGRRASRRRHRRGHRDGRSAIRQHPDGGRVAPARRRTVPAGPGRRHPVGPRRRVPGTRCRPRRFDPADWPRQRADADAVAGRGRAVVDRGSTCRCSTTERHPQGVPAGRPRPARRDPSPRSIRGGLFVGQHLSRTSGSAPQAGTQVGVKRPQLRHTVGPSSPDEHRPNRRKR